jgi:CHAD domain-containing protein
MPSAAPEYELKFGTGPDFSISEVLTAAGVPYVVDMPGLDLRATYYDTPDLRLARSGVTLRYRTGEDGGGAWTVKFPTKDPAVRQEVRLSGPPKTVPAEAADLVTAFTRGQELVRVATLSTTRKRWSLRDADGHEVAEVVDDYVAVRDGRRITQRFRELELEARTGNGQGIKQIATALTRRGAARLPLMPKVVRALGSRATAPPDIPQPPAVSPRSPASDAVRAALISDVNNVIMNDPAVRLDQPEGVHQMRVAVRRLRSHLRLFEPLLERVSADTLEDLRWIASELGRVRDLDVLMQRIAEQGADLRADLRPIEKILEAREDVARRSLHQALSSVGYVRFLDTLLQYVDHPAFRDAAFEQCRSAMPRLAGGTFSALVQAVRELQADSTHDKHHEVRIHAKRVRYAAEAIAQCLGKQDRNDALRLARAAENVQNILGERQDATVMRQLLLEAASEQPGDAAFHMALGRFFERQHQSIATNDARFWEAWTELNRKKNREWLNS